MNESKKYRVHVKTVPIEGKKDFDGIIEIPGGRVAHNFTVTTIEGIACWMLCQTEGFEDRKFKEFICEVIDG